MEEMRLNKYLSDRSVCSRREADRLIGAGRITVNGHGAVPGEKVTEEDVILVDGKPVRSSTPEKLILAVHKPAGVVCTTKRFPGEENIVDMVDFKTRLYPVGRLDKDSEGLIFLTNDGAFAEEVTKASNRHEKEYEVTVGRAYSDAFLKRMGKGVYLKDLDRTTAACSVEKISERTFRIVLTQGLNRQIRRMCEVCGYEVTALKRVRIMNVRLGDLKPRAYRKVEGEELETLLRQVKRKKPAGTGAEGAAKKSAVQGTAVNAPKRRPS